MLNHCWVLLPLRQSVDWVDLALLHRRSQKTFVSWEEFRTLLTHHPIASPLKLKNLIALRYPLWENAG